MIACVIIFDASCEDYDVAVIFVEGWRDDEGTSDAEVSESSLSFLLLSQLHWCLFVLIMFGAIKGLDIVASIEDAICKESVYFSGGGDTCVAV